MLDTDRRVRLVMTSAARDDLIIRAALAPELDARAKAMLDALRGREPVDDGRWRVACDELALAFVREEAPDLARRWPAVFGEGLKVPRVQVLTNLSAEAPGQRVAGVYIDRFNDGGTVRLDFESGDALIVEADGTIDWRSA